MADMSNLGSVKLVDKVLGDLRWELLWKEYLASRVRPCSTAVDVELVRTAIFKGASC